VDWQFQDGRGDAANDKKFRCLTTSGNNPNMEKVNEMADK
jgi:hypothetical protein